MNDKFNDEDKETKKVRVGVSVGVCVSVRESVCVRERECVCVSVGERPTAGHHWGES